MSEFIAAAQVIITPNTASFRGDLLAQLKAATEKPVSVTVTPDTKAFSKTLKTQLAALNQQTTQVLAQPITTGFKAALIEKIAVATKGVAASIPVVPLIAGFRKALIEQVAVASKGISVPVPVVPVVTDIPTQATKKAAAGTTGASQATKTARVKSAEEVANAEVAAQTKANAQMDKLHGQALAADIKRDKAAVASAEKAAAAEVAAQAKATKAKLALLEKETAALVGRAGRATAQAEKAAAASMGKIQAEALAENKRIDAQKVATQKAAIAAAKAEAAEIRRASKAAVAERGAAINAEKKSLLSRAKAAVSSRRGERDTFATAQNKATAATRALAQAETFESIASGQAARARQALGSASKAVVATQAAFNAALKTGDRVMQENTALQYANARALEVQRREAVRAAIANTELAASQEFVRRGAGATLLSMLGLRGATLAANASFIAGAAGAIVLAKSIQSAASLESELNVFRVTAAATADEMVRVGESASQLGRDVTLPGVSANDAAEAMTELSKAGLDVQDSIDGARGVLQLATAAQIDNAEATTLAASALNAFGLEGSEAVHVADVLTNAANAAQGSISDMGLSLQQAAAVARQVGVSFEDTTALLTLLARNGIRGSDAGTSLRVAFTKLINPTKKASEILRDLNVTLRDAEGNIRPEVFSDFARAQSNLTKKQQDANAAVVFGTDALRAYSIISREGVPALDAVRDKLARQGSAAELAGARMEGLEGKAENLKNQVEALGLKIGQNLLPPLEAAADLLIVFTSSLNTVTQGVENLRGRIESIPGGDLFSKFIALGPVQQQIEGIKALDAAIKDVTGETSRFEIILDTREAQEGARAVRAELNEILVTAQGLKGLDSQVTLDQTLFKLDEMTRKLAAGDENAQKLADSVRAVRREVAERGFAGFTVEADLKLSRSLQPAGLRDTGKTAANTLAQAFIEGIEQGAPGSKVFGVGAFLSQALADGINSGKDAVTDAAKQTAAAAIKGFSGQQAGLEEGMLDILLGGGSPTAQIANLRKQAAKQEQIIKAAGDKLTEARRAAKAKLDQINDEIERIEEGIKTDAEKAASDAKKRRDDAQKARDDADQAFLDSLGVRSDNLGLAELGAQLDGNLKQQLGLAKRRRQFILDEIALIQENVNDQKRAAAEIRKLRGELLQTDDTIEQLRVDISNALLGGLEKKLNLAELRGDQGAVAVILKLAIAEARRQVQLAIAAKEGVLDAKIKVQELIQARKDVIQNAIDATTDKFAKRIRLAELRGNKDAILAAMNAAIANARKQVAVAKKAKKGVLDAQIALEELIQQKEDFLDEAKDKGQGTTAFDLLTEAAEVFNQTAGSLIGGDQPFAGPTGFTADLAQFLKRKPGTQIDIVEKTAAQKDTAIVNLTNALDRNTDALLGKKTARDASPETSTAGDARRRRERFVQSMEAHEAQIA